jgi:hypothetical protein
MQFIWISFQMLEHQVVRVVQDSTSGFGQWAHPGACPHVTSSICPPSGSNPMH